MKERGSAILIAVFLVAAVGSVAFGIGRMFLAESNLANIYESSTVAYYAAESGIEEGFLRYRYNKNTEVPSSQVYSRNNLEDLTQLNLSQTDYNNFNPVANLKYYTLTMKYKADYYGADVTGDTVLNEYDLATNTDPIYPNEYFVPRDEAVKLDVSGIVNSSKDIFLYVIFVDDNNSTNCIAAKPFIETKATGNSPFSFSGLTEMKLALIDSGKDPGFATPQSYRQQTAYTTVNGLKVLRYENLLTMFRQNPTVPIFTAGSNQVELYIKPISCAVRIGMKPNVTATSLLAGPFSTVKSTGYYGGVTRTLEAKIDRQAGTVYDLFDFVLYKK